MDIYPPCPVQMGDRFYRKNYGNQHGMCIPDRIEVMSVSPLKEPVVITIGEDKTAKGYYKIHGWYMYHTIGPNLEKDFCDVIFQDPNWVIEKKGEKKC